MSNEKLRKALQDITDDYAERFDLDDPSTNPGIKIVIQQARQALATTEPEPTGMPEVKPWDHPEPQTMRWSDLEVRWIQAYGEQCWKAGYKHGAFSK